MTVHEHAKLLSSIRTAIDNDDKKLESFEKNLEEAMHSLSATAERVARLEGKVDGAKATEPKRTEAVNVVLPVAPPSRTSKGGQ